MDITSNFKNLALSGKNAKVLSWLPAVLTAALILWLAAKLAALTWLFFVQPEYDASVAAPQVRTTAANSNGNINQTINQIRGAHLFGKYVAPDLTAPLVPQDQEEIKEANIANLTLKGTVATTSDSDGLAIVEQDGEEKVYTIGDPVAPGYELEQVFADKIRLLKNGVIEKLMLAKLSDTGGSNRSNNSTRLNKRRTPARAAPSVATASKGLSSAPAKLGDLIRPRPVFENGKMLGYRVYPGRKREQFKALGLKAGDLVSEINGTRLDDPSSGLEVFRTLSDSTQVSVTIQRNGATNTLVLDTSQFTKAADQ